MALKSQVSLTFLLEEIIKMKVFEYEITLTDDNDNDYCKTGVIISENKNTAMNYLYQYYESGTTDYVDHDSIILKEITGKNIIIEE